MSTKHKTTVELLHRIRLDTFGCCYLWRIGEHWRLTDHQSESVFNLTVSLGGLFTLIGFLEEYKIQP